MAKTASTEKRNQRKQPVLKKIRTKTTVQKLLKKYKKIAVVAARKKRHDQIRNFLDSTNAHCTIELRQGIKRIEKNFNVTKSTAAFPQTTTMSSMTMCIKNTIVPQTKMSRLSLAVKPG